MTGLNGKLSLGGKIGMGIITLVELVNLAACSPKFETITKLEGVPGSTVASYAEQYCGEGKGKRADPNLWYYSLSVDKMQREKGDDMQYRNRVVGLQYDGKDFSCLSPWE